MTTKVNRSLQTHGDYITVLNVGSPSWASKKKEDSLGEKQIVISRSRIDLTLVTQKLINKIVECEILSAWAPLTHDHFPLRLTVMLPEPVPNMPVGRLEVSSDASVWKYKLAGLKDPDTRSLFQDRVSGLLSEQQKPVTYQNLRDTLHAAANDMLGVITRKVNPVQTEYQPPPLEHSRMHCIDVLSSWNHLLLKLLQPDPSGDVTSAAGYFPPC